MANQGKTRAKTLKGRAKGVSSKQASRVKGGGALMEAEVMAEPLRAKRMLPIVK